MKEPGFNPEDKIILSLATVVGALALALWLVLFCLLFAGCGPTPDYVTKHGLHIYDTTPEGIDRADIEEITARALDVTPYRRVDLEGWPVTLQPDKCGWWSQKGYRELHGSCLEGSVCVWAHQDPCLARTSFGHELLHLITWIKTDDEGSHAGLANLNRELWRRTVAMCHDE